MSKSLTQTVRLLRRSRVKTDGRGRTVWEGPVEETELGLVSTTMLRAMLDIGDAELSLVSTQALRRMLGQAEKKPDADTQRKEKSPGGGFDPYNSA